jgi:hypothetical protein
LIESENTGYAVGRRWQKTVSVEVLRPYVIEVTFEDGTRREIDLGPDLSGPVFRPLRDYALFRRADVDPLGGSVFWPTGADLAPEFLYLGEDEQDRSGSPDRPAAIPLEPKTA